MINLNGDHGTCDDSEVFPYLKAQLEPHFEVVANPDSGYFSQWRFDYQIRRDGALIDSLTGDFRDFAPGVLPAAAKRIVSRLKTDGAADTARVSPSRPLPIASRLPPKRSETTWFGSGRAAFAWLLKTTFQPRRVYFPTLICWSLLDVMKSRFPETTVSFYPVSESLKCDYPTDISPDELVVCVHYFGRQADVPTYDEGCVAEDLSHVPVGYFPPQNNDQNAVVRFGSLRKAYRVADGGFVEGRHNPVYETASPTDAWLRMQASDWRDLREAENMIDRSWAIRDISSQSLSTVLTTDTKKAAFRRLQNDRQLTHSLTCGEPLIPFDDSDFPLLHCRTFSTTGERDSLRQFLMQRQVFTSIHWPVHDTLLQQRDRWDIDGALWLADHSLAFPISEDFEAHQIDQMCDAVREWTSAGAARFVPVTTGQ